MKFVYYVGQLLLYLWQLPQNILGLLVFACYSMGFRLEYVEHMGRHFFIYPAIRAGVSLGNYNFIDSYDPIDGSKTIHHEYGHTLQSLYLGPLYLLVIGIPSFVWACLHTWVKSLRSKDYYAFYTERWADRLGGVER